MVTLLNTSILTAYGQFSYTPITREAAKSLLWVDCPNCRTGEPCQMCGTGGVLCNYQSAIGHESTAQLLSKLLDVNVQVNRIAYTQGVGEQAIVFKLNGRPPEGVVLSFEDLEAIGYEFGLLERLG